MLATVGTIAFGIVGVVFFACGCVGLVHPTLFRRWFPPSGFARNLSLDKSELYTRVLAALWMVLGGSAVMEMWRGF
jgi:hypothetical protein